ncbi:nuclease [Kosakonia sp.]|uniref:nuclease n=1 Tax=Kosakonia sp. TaxID=1916651 RepID=UPI00289CE934|nr:nuclease [Kosakonia sp.]
MLLTLADIEQQLAEKFSPFDGEMDELLLIKRRGPVGDIRALEQSLNVRLSGDFLAFLSRYDLDHFSLGNIAFGTGQDYLAQVIALNQGDAFNRWWPGVRRPEGIIVIALSDPYTLLLNTLDQRVYAMTSEPTAADDGPVADSFALFIRGVGSLFLQAASPQEVAGAVGAVNLAFWQEIA